MLGGAAARSRPDGEFCATCHGEGLEACWLAHFDFSSSLGEGQLREDAS